MKNDYVIQFHSELEAVVEAEVRGVADKVRGAWMVGGCDMSKPVINFMWYRYLGLREAYIANKGDAETFQTIRQSLGNLLVKQYNIDDNIAENKVWEDILKDECGKILIFASSPRIVEYLRPVVCSMDEDFVLLTPCEVGYIDELPDCATVVKFTFSNIDIYTNDLLAQNFQLVYRFANTIGNYIRALKPRLLVCMDGCQTEYEMAALFCRQLNIPSVCIQQGWPSMLHEGFHDMPYTYFFTWGKGFNSLWKARNRNVNFIDTGYLYEVKDEGAHSAITFFLQAPVFLLTETYLNRMYKLISIVAERYRDNVIMVREHPEYKATDRQKEEWKAYPNIRNVSEMPLADVFAQTYISVSCFSSSIMESVVHGCVPLVFSPAIGARYNPDIENEGLGWIAEDEETFLAKLNEIMYNKYEQFVIRENKKWFESTGMDSVCTTVRRIKELAKSVY